MLHRFWLMQASCWSSRARKVVAKFGDWAVDYLDWAQEKGKLKRATYVPALLATEDVMHEYERAQEESSYAYCLQCFGESGPDGHELQSLRAPAEKRIDYSFPTDDCSPWRFRGFFRAIRDLLDNDVYTVEWIGPNDRPLVAVYAHEVRKPGESLEDLMLRFPYVPAKADEPEPQSPVPGIDTDFDDEDKLDDPTGDSVEPSEVPAPPRIERKRFTFDQAAA